MKALYITDEINTCDCCGRTDLKATVAMQLSDGGGILHYGRTCAARNSGKTSKQIRQDVYAEEAAAIGRADNIRREVENARHALAIIDAPGAMNDARFRSTRTVFCREHDPFQPAPAGTVRPTFRQWLESRAAQ
jgi:hypothetical protein